MCAEHERIAEKAIVLPTALTLFPTWRCPGALVHNVLVAVVKRQTVRIVFVGCHGARDRCAQKLMGKPPLRTKKSVVSMGCARELRAQFLSQRQVHYEQKKSVVWAVLENYELSFSASAKSLAFSDLRLL